MTTTAARRSVPARAGTADDGFTLIELLVVVIIIGILAAIAIPVYVGLQSSTKDTAAKSDLTNARIALQSYSAANPSSWPAISASDGAANAAALGRYGWAGAAVLDASTTAGGSATAWCLVRASGTGTSFYVTQSVAPTSTKPAGCS